MDRITREGCESINGTAVGAVPVTALETGETYKNIYCAICHGNHHRLARWQLDVKCDNSVYMNTSLQMDSLGNCRLKIKKPSEAPLQPCTGTERKRRSTIGRGNPDKDCSKTPSLGYSTLLNFGLDGQTHYLLTSDMEEFLSKSLCASDNTIFNPFRKTCIRLDCPQDQISYDGKCINQTANGEKLKLVCVDYQIDFTLYHPTLTDVNEQDFDKSLINVWVTKEGLHPANEVLPRQDLNQSLCSEGDGSFRKNFRRSNTYNPRELMLTDTENCNVSDGTTTDSTGEDNSVRQLFVSLEAYVKSEEEERHMLEMSPFVIHEKTEEIVGAGCASAVSTTVLDGNWCSGFKKEYKNDEFEVLTVTDGKVRLVGIYVFSTNKTYYQSEFQYTAVVNGQFWGNISQVAIVCDKQDDEYKAPASCTKLALGADDYTTLPDGSIHVPAFQKFSEIELPFETEKREEIKNTFAPSEYWTITNDTLPGEFNATAGNSSEPTVSVCMPESLLALLIELQLWDRVHVTASCSYLAPFGHGSSIAGLVCSGLSMLAMVAALVTYTLFKSLRTLPGVCLMHLTAAILLSQISFFVNLFLPVPGLEEDYSCFSLAALTHYFILASFFWMNVMAFTSYRAFGADLKTQLHQYKRRDLVCNSLYGWGVPAVIVTTCTAIDYCLRDERLIGYGVISTIKVSEERNTSTDMIENIQIRYRTMALCWISNSTAALIVFGVPLVYSMVVNVSFFIKTCIGKREQLLNNCVIIHTGIVRVFDVVLQV